MNSPIEMWKPVEGYEGIYEISSFGNLRSLPREVLRVFSGKVVRQQRKGQIITAVKNADGYLVLMLHKAGTAKHASLHRLVAKVFIPNLTNSLEVNHINAIKTDNRIENLEWLSHTDNLEHAFSLGIGNIRTKVLCSNGKEYKSITEASKDLNINPGHLHQALNGKLRHAKGFTFRKAI